MTYEEIKRKHYYKLDDSQKCRLDKEIQEEGFNNAFNRHLTYIDCSVCLSNGMRIIQTINENYNYELSRCVYIIETLKDDIEKYKLAKKELIDKHLSNLKFEEEVPPMVYVKKQKGSSKKKVYKEKDMFPNEPKISRSEARLKAKLIGANISFGSFKLKK